MSTRDTQDLEHLERENEALNEQVKLLVRTEQRLYRSQNALDRQLGRIRSLGQFALQGSSLQEPDEILERALELIDGAFQVDRVLALRCDRAAESFRPTFAPGGASPADALVPSSLLEPWRAEQRDVELSQGRELDPALAPILARVGAAAEDIEFVVAAPVRVDSRLFGLIVFWQARSAKMFHPKDPPSQDHLPFIRLLVRHVEHALQSVALLRDLTDRSQELARKNEQLTVSLAELDRAQRQLVQARKMEAVGRLAGGIAHDFNNLLTVILNHADILGEALPSGSLERKSVEGITQASGQAAKITAQLLAFSRNQPGSPEVLDLSALVVGMTQMVEPLLGAETRFEIHAHPELPLVFADRAQVEQVLLNLVVNARDAMPDGGTLSLVTRPATWQDARECEADIDPADHVALEVTDTGHGMSSEVLPRIFEPFFTTKRLGHGTGLGLATVYGAVRQNHGYIHASSAPDRGSTFTVQFRRATASDETFAARMTAEVEGREAATILVVEDQEAVRRTTATLLRRRGFRILESADAESALSLARGSGETIDGLLTDIVLPGMGGVELAQTLRTLHADLPIVFMSGYPASNNEPAVLNGLGPLVAKPFTGERLVSALQQARLRVGEGREPG